MPKSTNLHPKGKPKSIQKQCSNERTTSSSSYEGSEQENAVRQFELELCWCIQQLERTLQQKKASEKDIQDSWKVLQVLKNNNQPIIRKRQLMRTHFGDYRAKMLAEEKKLTKMASKMKISEKPENPKATFLRRSVFQSTGDSSFRFNFNLAPELVDDGNTNTNSIDASGNAGYTEKRDNIGNTEASQGDGPSPVERKLPVTEDGSKKFKFSFSGSEFKFNFNVDNS